MASRVREAIACLTPRGTTLLTIIVVGDTGIENTELSFLQQTAAPETFELIHDEVTHALRKARGSAVIYLPAGTLVSPTFVDEMLSTVQRNAYTVPIGDKEPPALTADKVGCALRVAGISIPIEIARKTASDCAGFFGADLILRVAAIVDTPLAVQFSTASQPIVPATEVNVEPSVGAFSWLATLRLIDSLGRKSGRVSAPIGQIARSISSNVGRHVARDLGIRNAVLDAVDAHPIQSFSYNMMNAECSQDLVISYAFPPYLDTSGFVMARKLADRPDAYDVVTQDMSSHRVVDERSSAMVRRDVGLRMLIGGRAALGSWDHIERFCTRGMTQIEEREAALGEYRSLYSRSMWPASTVLAAWYKVRHPHTPWTAELSDPLTVRPNGETRENPIPSNEILEEIKAAVLALGRPGWSGEYFFEAVEWMVYALADKVVFTNDNQREFMISAWPNSELATRAREISVVEHHPVPKPALYQLGTIEVELPANKVTIAYFGNFYEVRGVEDILDPFAELTFEERSRVSLMIFTKDVAGANEAVAEHLAADCVTLSASLPYFDFLALTTRVDWLVLADAHRPATFSNNPYLPSKLADYRGSGTQIWGMVDEGSTLSREPLDATSPLGDSGAGAEVIRRQILN